MRSRCGLFRLKSNLTLKGKIRLFAQPNVADLGHKQLGIPKLIFAKHPLPQGQIFGYVFPFDQVSILCTIYILVYQ
jgi:hypothetical protein